MKLHELKPKIGPKKRKKVGRGNASGHGTYSGRGIKGQKSRSGYKHPASSLIGKLPKLRGLRFPRTKKDLIVTVNLKDLEAKFKTGENVNLASLVKSNLLKQGKMKKIKKVKVLGVGKLSKKLKYGSEILFSKKAKRCLLL